MEIKRIFRFYVAVLIVGMFVQGVGAVSFPTFNSSNGGDVGQGNMFGEPELHYDGSYFGYTGERNIYVVTDANESVLVEPISWVIGDTPITLTLISRGTSDLLEGVIYNGYFYFSDSQGLKKRKNKGSGGNASDLDIVSVISTDVARSLVVIDNLLYYYYSGNLKSLDGETDTISVRITGISSYAGTPLITKINNEITVYSITCLGSACATAGGPVHVITLYKSNNTGVNYNVKTLWTQTGYSSAVAPPEIMFNTNSYLYVNSLNFDQLLYHNYSTYIDMPGYITTGASIMVGEYSTIGLAEKTTNTYETFSFYESGLGSGQTFPAELTYNIANVQSVYPTYYNNSVVKINVDLELTITEEQYEDNNFNHRVDIVNSTSGLPIAATNVIIPCERVGYWYIPPFVISYNCILHTQYKYESSTTWDGGSYTAKLYEQNRSTSRDALLDSDTFTILNVSGTLVAETTSSADIHSGTNQESLNVFDGLLIYTGLGNSAISKLMFALIVTVCVILVGFRASNDNQFGGMICGFASYAFFTYIDYIPKWIFVIIVVVIAMKAGWFR